MSEYTQVAEAETDSYTVTLPTSSDDIPEVFSEIASKYTFIKVHFGEVYDEEADNIEYDENYDDDFDEEYGDDTDYEYDESYDYDEVYEEGDDITLPQTEVVIE